MLGQAVGMFDLGKEQFVSHECNGQAVRNQLMDDR